MREAWLANRPGFPPRAKLIATMKANLFAVAPIALLASALVGLTSQHARAEARDVFTKSFAVASGGN